METQVPESRVLIVMTGGTICMKPTANGLAPSKSFLENGMSLWPIFNDGSNPGEFHFDEFILYSNLSRSSPSDD